MSVELADMDAERAIFIVKKYSNGIPDSGYTCPAKHVKELKDALKYLFEKNYEVYYDRINVTI